ncbi:MAG TPA: 23S rRNA (pseudouridine(1915)-N(3))-methyltransferase RlmH [Candidatus Poseidoniales archaeon]|nr:23S rRNA (pseudouridine(1915)-N(3))-methyltransferase RlmH [Candidatus Poseidoniales archaeon]
MGRVVVHRCGKASVREAGKLTSLYAQRLGKRGVTLQMHTLSDTRYLSMIKELTGAVILLDEGGEVMNTDEMSELWSEWKIDSRTSHIVIGPTDGFPDEFMPDAARLSLSRMTFTKDLACAVVMEQLWRLSEIERGSPYHRDGI